MLRTHLIVATLALTASVALAAEDPDEWDLQPDYSGLAMGLMMPSTPLTTRDVERFSDALELDDAQQMLLDDLYNDLLSRSRRDWTIVAERASDGRHEAQVQQDWENMQTLQNELAEELGGKQDALLSGFLDDVKLILTPEQEELWDRAYRDHQRAHTIGEYASYDEEMFDLISVTVGLELTDELEATLEPMLEAYVSTIDPLLAARNRRVGELGERYAEWSKAQMSMWQSSAEMDGAERQGLMVSLEEQKRELITDAFNARESCARVRDVNVQYRDMIMRELSGDLAEDFSRMTNIDLEDEVTPWANFSRAKGMIGMLRNLKSMTDLMSTQMGALSGETELSYITMARAAEPLSRDQLAMLDDIEERLDAELEAIEREHAKAAGRQAPAESDIIRVRTPKGTLTLYRLGTPNPWPAGSRSAWPECHRWPAG
ncbi:MAG: hypothetical protein AAFX05_13145 [Planctomycetota bacterium]